MPRVSWSWLSRRHTGEPDAGGNFGSGRYGVYGLAPPPTRCDHAHAHSDPPAADSQARSHSGTPFRMGKAHLRLRWVPHPYRNDKSSSVATSPPSPPSLRLRPPSFPSSSRRRRRTSRDYRHRRTSRDCRHRRTSCDYRHRLVHRHLSRHAVPFERRRRDVSHSLGISTYNSSLFTVQPLNNNNSSSEAHRYELAQAATPSTPSQNINTPPPRSDGQDLRYPGYVRRVRALRMEHPRIPIARARSTADQLIQHREPERSLPCSHCLEQSPSPSRASSCTLMQL